MVPPQKPNLKSPRSTEAGGLLKIVSWNINGFNSLNNMATADSEFIIGMDILCFVETWLLQDKFTKPHYLTNFDYIQVLAHKHILKVEGVGGP